MQIRFSYRLGIDLGANSLGWCILKLDSENQPSGIVRMGSRIFRDGRNPKDKTSLAVARRQARQMRRRRDRFLKRRDRLLDALIKHGYFPAEKNDRLPLSSLDPYLLRAKGLDDSLTPFEFGRAVFHLNQRRGFKSNRKTDKAADGEKETGKIKFAIGNARKIMEESGVRTLGEWLASRHKNRESVRARLRGNGAKAVYDLYVDREMIADEFEQLFAAQRKRQPNLFTAAAHDEIKDILLFQRRLRPVEPGRCTLEPDDACAPLALPSVQRFRIYQELNNLRLVFDADFSERTLGKDERDAMAELLERHPKRTFGQLRRCIKESRSFNLESEKRSDLKGNATSVALAKDTMLGDTWFELHDEIQEKIVEQLISIESEIDLIDALQQQCRLSAEQAQQLTQVGLVDGYGNLGKKAIAKILPHLQNDVITYDKAVKAAGYDSHSEFYDGVVHEELPYYGLVLNTLVAGGTGNPKDTEEKRIGRIANPTVHIGLNQVRKVTNAIIKRYGHPTHIVMEVARELKMGKDKKDRLQKDQLANQERNRKHDEKLTELGHAVNGENRLRLRLWEELNIHDPLNRHCPYSGKQIGIDMLFSGEVEIEHILPFSMTLDDGINNKTICIRQANRDKGNQTPHQAFGHSPTLSGHKYDWNAIIERVQTFPKAKREKFAQNAFETYLREHKDFLARHLTDTQYLSRAAKDYLSAICPPNAISVTPGRLTALLRGKWGLNRILSDSDNKDRNDHRHHAVDAAVIAVTDRAMLQRIATAAQFAREQQLDRLIEKMPLPWDSFHEDLNAAVGKIVVSYKPDHGHQDKIHNDTAYGIVEGPDKKGVYCVVHRVPLSSFGKPEDFDAIRDATLKTQLQNFCNGYVGKDFVARVAKFSEDYNVRRTRITENISVIPIAEKSNAENFFKAYKGDGNYCVEIYRDERGKWRDKVISTYEAYKSKPPLLRHPHFASNGNPLMMRLCQDDVVAWEVNSFRCIMRVVKFSKGQVVFAEHIEAGNLKARDADTNDPFKYVTKSASSLYDVKARRIFVDPLGFVMDPGFRP